MSHFGSLLIEKATTMTQSTFLCCGIIVLSDNENCLVLSYKGVIHIHRGRTWRVRTPSLASKTAALIMIILLEIDTSFVQLVYIFDNLYYSSSGWQSARGFRPV